MQNKFVLPINMSVFTGIAPLSPVAISVGNDQAVTLIYFVFFPELEIILTVNAFGC